MNLFTDDNPETTIHGLGFSSKIKAIKSIEKVEKHFNKLLKKQKINTMTPDNLRPKKLIKNKEDAIKFYEMQKMYRIIGLRNRAKVFIQKNKDIEEAFQVLDNWLKEYNKN